MVVWGFYSILMVLSLMAQADSNLESIAIAKQAEQSTIKNIQIFKPAIESAKERIENEAEFYKEIVSKAKISQERYTEELSKQTIESDSLIDQIITNHKNIESLEDRNSLIVFVSFSMPKELLWEYHQQIRNYGGRMVIRGLVENSFKQTIQKMKIDGNRALTLDINPKLFEEYGVKQVPTIVISNNLYFDKFTGSVSVSHALEQSNEFGEAKIISAKYLERGVR